MESQLLYGLIIWGSKAMGTTNRLFILRKKAKRILDSAKYNSNTEPLFKRHKLLKLSDLYQLVGIKFYCSIAEKICPGYFVNCINLIYNHSYNTRQNLNIYILHKCKFNEQSIIFKLEQAWNKLSNDMKQIQHSNPLHLCFAKIKKYLISKYKMNNYELTANVKTLTCSL